MTNSQALRHLHHCLRRLQAMDQALDVMQLNQQEQGTMLDPTVTAKIKELSDAIDVVAAHLAQVISNANTNGSLTAAEITAALQPAVDRLKVLGTDPEVPVPPDARFAR